jgi:hypothetical protein
MAVIIACVLFAIVTGVAWRFYPLIPKFVKNNLEFFLVIIGFVGVLAAISQISADTRKTKSLELVNEAKEMFGYMMQQIEYRMDECQVWWDVALDQTNKDPEVCRKDKECSNTCRIAHFVSQYRWRPIDTEVDDWENFRMLICDNPEGNEEENKIDPLCPSAIKFFEALDKANESKLEADKQPFSNKFVLMVIQFLIAIGLGLEAGKLKSRKQKSLNN